MVAQRHVIEVALDLARMPVLANTANPPPIPRNVIEIMRIAAGASKPCQEAAASTGAPIPVLIDAARFFLQHALLRPDADSYRVLGLQPGASRATARQHMRWLMEWLHPDRNSDLDSVYADRILTAWRAVAAASDSGATQSRAPARRRQRPPRLPWIEIPVKRHRPFFAWVLPIGIIALFLALCSVVYYLGPDQVPPLASGR